MFINRNSSPAKLLVWLSPLLFEILYSLNLSAQPISGLPFVRTFHTVEYQAGIQNWVITQDRRGILYVANNFGLLEFDGVKWQTHSVRNGTKVRTVAIDGKGKIYVGSQGDFGYFFPDEQGSLRYTSLADSLEEKYRNFDEAWNIFIDKETVYFCTFSRIYVYDGKSFRVVEHDSPLDLSFLVNRDLGKPMEVEVRLADGQVTGLVDAECLWGTDPKATNTFENPYRVQSCPHDDVCIKDGVAVVTLPPLSVYAGTFALSR